MDPEMGVANRVWRRRVCVYVSGEGGGIWTGVEKEGRDVAGGWVRGKYMYMLH